MQNREIKYPLSECQQKGATITTYIFVPWGIFFSLIFPLHSMEDQWESSLGKAFPVAC
jgi:hypothetical protein